MTHQYQPDTVSRALLDGLATRNRWSDRESLNVGAGARRAQPGEVECVAATVANIAEIGRAKYGPREFPEVDIRALYEAAREYGRYRISDGPGITLAHGLECYCEMAAAGGSRVKWMRLNRPGIRKELADVDAIEPEPLMAWLAASGLPFGLNLMMFAQDFASANRVLEGGPGIAPGHALTVHGFIRGFSFRRWWIFRKKSDVFLCEDSFANRAGTWYLPAYRTRSDRHAYEAATLVPFDLQF